MNHAVSLPVPTIAPETNFVRAIRKLPAVTWPCFVAAVMLSTMALARLPGMTAPVDEEKLAVAMAVSEEPAAEDAPAAIDTKARSRSRCDTCGFVETIRRVEPEGIVPAGYEFTVRLRDGSARISSDASSAKWHIGDRVMLIGGSPARN